MNEKNIEKIVIIIINFLKYLFEKKIVVKNNISKKKDDLSPVK